MTERTADPKLAATVLLLRYGNSELEVFMVERHHQIDFATGALVFPGGKVDPSDAAPGLRERCSGARDLDDQALAVRVAAIRETFEESGVLLARPRGREKLLSPDRLRRIDETYRAALQGGSCGMRELAEAEDLELACDRLVPFAHWITPEFMPKRFDTYFFLVAAPENQAAVHDGRESVDSLWISPIEAIETARSGRHIIVPATVMNLGKLARSQSVTEAIKAAREDNIVTVLPQVETNDRGERVFSIPPEAGYPALDVPTPRPPTSPGSTGFKRGSSRGEGGF